MMDILALVNVEVTKISYLRFLLSDGWLEKDVMTLHGAL